jgi:hypothetical protein
MQSNDRKTGRYASIQGITGFSDSSAEISASMARQEETMQRASRKKIHCCKKRLQENAAELTGRMADVTSRMKITYT